MPEIPDLQVFCKNLHQKFAGKKIKKISVANPARLNVPVSSFIEYFEGQVLDRVHRVGKRLYFVFNNGHVMSLHLLLNGELSAYDKTHEFKHALVDMFFTDGSGLVMTDLRHLAKIEINPGASGVPDVLSKDVNYQFLKTNLSASKSTIKKFLLNQEKISGIGNAYSDEILWHCGISPFSICDRIPDAKIRALDKSIKMVLQEAEQNINLTHPGLITGEVRDFLDIHSENKTHSPGGAPIQMIVTGGRRTFFTEEQQLFQ
jgi:formamidopyrimidine-DNA glycosylase